MSAPHTHTPSHPHTRTLSWFLLLILFLAPTASVQAQERPRAVLILLSEVPSEPLLRRLQEAKYAFLREGSAVGVMNAAVRGPGTSESAALTLGASSRIDASDRSHGGSLAKAGTLAAALRDAKKRVLHLSPQAGPGRSGAAGLIFMDRGRFPQHQALPADAWAPLAAELVGTQDLLAVDFSNGEHEPALRFAQSLAGHLDPERDLILITSPAPGAARDGAWQYLSPLVLWGAPWRGKLLTSTTTRTHGLIANIDIAPTLLTHLGVPVPESMEGHPARAVPGTLAELLAFAAHARVTRKLMVPVLLGWAGLALTAVFTATLALVGRGGAAMRMAAQLLVSMTAAFVAAMLLSAALPAQSEADLIARVVVLTVGIGVAAVWLGRKGSPFMLIVLFGTVLVLGDLLTGGRMLARNLMSDFANIGARFYGIGNEYLGILLCVAVLTPFWIDRNRGSHERLSRAGWVTAAILWPVSLIAAGAPTLGADFGGAVALGLTFLIAASLGAGVRPTGKQVLVGLLLVGLVGAAAVAADLARPVGSRTHVGELAARALEGRAGEVAEVVYRKIALNVSFALSPAVLGGVAIMTPVFVLWYRRLGRHAWQVLSAVPKVRAGVLTILAGGIIAGVLNDTGVVAWAMATCCAILLWLDLLLANGKEQFPLIR